MYGVLEFEVAGGQYRDSLGSIGPFEMVQIT